MSEYLVSYDICAPRRLVRVHRLLRREATALQYSVFLYSGSERQHDRLLADIARLIEPKEDDVRAWPVPARGMRIRLGTPPLPQGIYWSALPAPWQPD